MHARVLLTLLSLATFSAPATADEQAEADAIRDRAEGRVLIRLKQPEGEAAPAATPAQ
jgi:hypothetical protein